MKRTIILGGLVGVGGFVAYNWWLQRKLFPDGVPPGNLLRGAFPFLPMATAAGALAGYAVALR
jgi:hypothetical protein